MKRPLAYITAHWGDNEFENTIIGQDKNKTIIHHCLNVGGKPEEGTEPAKTAYWKHSVHNLSLIHI